MESVAQTKPIVQNYRPKGGLFEYYGRKTKDGAVMSPTPLQERAYRFRVHEQGRWRTKGILAKKKEKKARKPMDDRWLRE